jgi:glycosyltransferase involved in cell wall biosynthesis
MAAGAPVLARDTVYNREVLGAAGRFVDADPAAIAKNVLHMMDSETDLDDASRANVRRAQEDYSWTQVCAAYERELRRLLRA